MGDSWEDWDDEEAVPAIPAPAPALAPAQPAAKFADEDAEEEAPKWAGNVPAPQQASEGYWPESGTVLQRLLCYLGGQAAALQHRAVDHLHAPAPAPARTIEERQAQEQIR